MQYYLGVFKSVDDHATERTKDNSSDKKNYALVWNNSCTNVCVFIKLAVS